MILFVVTVVTMGNVVSNKNGFVWSMAKVVSFKIRV